MLLGQNVRNKIINGRFDYWQRGTSFNLAANGRTADRYAVAVDASTGSLAAGTITKQSGGYLPGQTSFMRITNTTTGTQAGGSYAVVPHSIEDVRTFSGKTVTLSIWASSTIASKQIRFYCSQYFGSGGSSAVSFIPTAPTQSTHTLTTSVARYDVTFDIPSITGKTVGTSSRLEFGVVLAYGPTNSASFFGLPQLDWQGTGNIDIYGVQVNEGPPADFELAGGGDLGIELLLCQRYYWKSYDVNTNPGTAGVFEGSIGTIDVSVGSGGSNTMYLPVVFPVKMRGIPIAAMYNPSSGAINSLRNSSGVVNVNFSSVAVACGQGGVVNIQINTASSTITNGQACQFHLTADAEF